MRLDLLRVFRTKIDHCWVLGGAKRHLKCKDISPRVSLTDLDVATRMGGEGP